jgi:hypothetical protein
MEGPTPETSPFLKTAGKNPVEGGLQVAKTG